MRNLLARYVIVLLAVGACKSDEGSKATATPAAAKPVEAAPAPAPAPPPPAPVPCGGPEAVTLVEQLRTANGVGVDYSDAEAGKARVAAAVASINGKRVSLTGCAFKGQGNDEVSFAPAVDSPYEQQVTCKMAGGEAGNRTFRDAAMSLDTAKMKLDVIGTVASYQDVNNFTRYTLTECTITPHE